MVCNFVAWGSAAAVTDTLDGASGEEGDGMDGTTPNLSLLCERHRKVRKNMTFGRHRRQRNSSDVLPI
jgi:hypothetical protein